MTSSLTRGQACSSCDSRGAASAKLLEAVEHQQPLLPAQRRHGLGERVGGRAAAELARQPVAEVGCRGQVLDGDEQRAVGETRVGLVRRLSRQRRLADAAGTDQAQQAAVVAREQLGDAAPFGAAPDEPRLGRAGVDRAGEPAGRGDRVVQRLQLGGG